MIVIDYLKNHPTIIPQLSQLWKEAIGKIWDPNTSLEKVESYFSDHVNSDSLPLTFIAFKDNIPIGMCSLRQKASVRPDLSPWLGSLTVDSQYQGQGIGKKLIDATKAKARELGFQKLYLCTYDKTLPSWYKKLGWQSIGSTQCGCHPVELMEISLNQIDAA